MDKTWDQIVETELSATTGRSWVMNLFGSMVMDLRDGSWLDLNENLLRLYPGTSKREETIWVKGTDVETIKEFFYGAK